MAKSFTISMILQMVNKIGGPAAAAMGALNKLDDKTKAVAKSLAEMGNKMKDSGKKMMGSLGGTAALVAPILAVSKAAGSFESSMQKIASITGQTTQEVMNTYGKRAMKFARETGQRIEDIAQAQYDAISRNVPTAEVDAFIRSSLKTAKVGTTTVAITTKALAMLRNVWGEMPTEQMGGLLAQAQQFGGTEIAEISQNFGRVAMQLKNAGVTAEEGLSLVASLTQTGNIEESITGMAAMMRTIVKPTEQFTKEMKTLGINLSVSTIKEYGLAKSMKILQEAINRTYKTEDERIKAMGRAFNETMAFNAVLNFTSENGMDVYTKSLNSMKSSTDFLTNRSKQMGTTLTEESGKVRESFKGIMISLGIELMPIIRGAVEGLGSMIGHMRDLVGGNKILQDALKGLAFAFVVIISTVKLAGAVMWIWGNALIFASGAVSVFSGVLKAARFAVWLFNMAFVSSPIGWIVIAIAALVVGLVLLIKHWDAVKRAASAFGETLRRVFMDSAIGRALLWLFDKLVAVGTWFYELGKKIGKYLYDGIKDSVSDALDWVEDKLGQVDDWLSGRKLQHAYVKDWSGVMNSLSGVVPDATRPTGNAITVTLNGGINVNGGSVADLGRQAWGALKPTLEAEIAKMNRNNSRKGMGDK
jgi:TP901 family phage tail tape measure protein